MAKISRKKSKAADVSARHAADLGWKDVARGKAKRMTKEQFLKEMATW